MFDWSIEPNKILSAIMANRRPRRFPPNDPRLWFQILLSPYNIKCQNPTQSCSFGSHSKNLILKVRFRAPNCWEQWSLIQDHNFNPIEPLLPWFFFVFFWMIFWDKRPRKPMPNELKYCHGHQDTILENKFEHVFSMGFPDKLGNYLLKVLSIRM